MLTRVVFALLVVVFAGTQVLAEDGEPKTTVVALGLTDHKVAEEELTPGAALAAPKFNSPGVAYVLVAHARAGDTVEVHLTKDGKSLMQNMRELDADEPGLLLQAGKTGVPAGGWPKGSYTARVTVTRDGETIAEQETDAISLH